MACEQYTRLGTVTDSMWLINIFQILYVADGLYNEVRLLPAFDLTTAYHDIACDSDDNGHNDRWFWVHVGHW